MRLMIKAAWVRGDRALTALLSIMVVAIMATVSLTVFFDLESKLNREFRSFGANTIATARNGSLSADDLIKIKSIVGPKAEVVPVRYAVVTRESDSHIVVGGTDLADFQRLNASWSFTPADNAGKLALVGSRVAEGNSNHNPAARVLRYGANTIEIPARSAVFKSGSDEDSRIYLDLQQFEKLTGLPPDTAQLRIEGPPAEIEQQIAKLSASLPQVEVKPVRQVTSVQTAVLGKTRAIVLAASAIVVVLIVVCMVATLTGSVLERRKDFAVMKALGASNATVNLLFAGEAMLLSAAGALIGFFVGSGIAYWIGQANFGAAITPRPGLLLPVLLGSILLALASSTAPLRLLRRIQPAVILRGE